MDVATLSNKLNETTGYVVRPNFEEKFRSTKVQEILYSCISDVLGGKKFEQEACAEWTKANRTKLYNMIDDLIIRHH
ncbi:unnamed protein product [Rotaria socialis]|uniref:Uncharacterized protein n=1 Tax=Rotaria socialis TaxID=392032 RepID=A0A821YTV2_9BILA|nr:unnamed protein product [Rotaria socialis]